MIKLKTPIPVTLLTGFLGSGKTTLLNQLIRQMPHTAIVMNEFGEIGLDHQLLEKTDGPLALLAGGCVCCTVKGSLSPTLKNLFMSASSGSIPAFERVIVETTGVADPTPIIETLINDRWVAARFQLQGVVTTIDAVLGEQQLDSYEESLKQVAVADRLILTKTDLAKPDQISDLVTRIRTINQSAPMISVIKGVIDPTEIFHASAYNPAGSTTEVKSWVTEARFLPAQNRALMSTNSVTHDPHENRIKSYSIYRDEPLEWDALYAALKKIVSFSPKHILRVKGLINLTGKNVPTVVHGVQHVLYPPVELAEWPDDDQRSRLVIITYDMDEAVAHKLIDEIWTD